MVDFVLKRPLAAFSAVLLMALASGYLYYRAEMALLQLELGSLQSEVRDVRARNVTLSGENAALAGSIEEQNAAIVALEQDAQARDLRAAARVAAVFERRAGRLAGIARAMPGFEEMNRWFATLQR